MNSGSGPLPLAATKPRFSALVSPQGTHDARSGPATAGGNRLAREQRPAHYLTLALVAHDPTLSYEEWDTVIGAIDQRKLGPWPNLEADALPPPLRSWPEGDAWIKKHILPLRGLGKNPGNAVREARASPHPRPAETEAHAPAAETANNQPPPPSPPPPPMMPLLPPQPAVLLAPVPPPPVDIQNLVLLPRVAPGGGRPVDFEYPNPRAHLHGKTGVKPVKETLFTPEPTGGFPRIRLDHPERPFAGLDVDTITEWNANPATTILGYVYGGSAIKAGETLPTVNKITAALQQFTGLMNIIVAHTELPLNPRNFDHRDLSTHSSRFFIGLNFTPDAARDLWRIQIVSTKDITLVILPTYIRFDDFVGKIVGFTHNVNSAIVTIIKKKLETEPVRAIFIKYLKNNPLRNHEDLETALQRVYDSLRIEVSTNDDVLSANFLIDTPAGTIAEWESWKDDLFGVEWKIPAIINGTGVFKRFPQCRGCMSVDHETKHCPLPDVRDWMGDTREQLLLKMNRSAAANQMRGGRSERGGPSGRRNGRNQVRT